MDTTVTPPSPAGFERLPDVYRVGGGCPIYEAVERLWLQQGRAVPRQHVTDVPADGHEDLFARA